jgi:hypothetical protein
MADRSSVSPQQTNPFTAILRMTWLMIGPVAAGISIFFLAVEATGPSWIDAAVALSLLGTLVARYVDIVFFRGETADGRVATTTDFWRYAAMLTAAVGAAWAIAHGSRLI